MASKAKFRSVVPSSDHPRVQSLDRIDIKTYSNARLTSPRPATILQSWLAKLDEPFVGITSDGHKKEGVFALADEGAPIDEMYRAATQVVDSLTGEERNIISHDIDSNDWRKWSNPELLIFQTGLRLENLTAEKRDAILALLRVSLSPAGYEKAIGAMKINGFLGELMNARPIMNEYSYQFVLFGTPSKTEPWGFSLFGHHLCLNIFVLGTQMVISPFFVGAEPNIVDDGENAGLEICSDEAIHGLKLMQTLPKDLQDRAQTYQQLHSDKMPPGRWHPADQRHMAGAFQDNRIIPYEGITASSIPEPQQKLLFQCLEAFLVFLPAGPKASRLKEISKHLDETFFSWIGGYTDDDPFYYRIQSPVILVEFDHHSGVFLLNREPEKFHIHTILRTPNGNDYGRELLRLYQGE